MYVRLNHMNLCLSYQATLRLIDEVSSLHTVPLNQWIKDGIVFKFWGDNVDKKRKVRDLRSDNQGEMLHMFSILVGRSRTPASHLRHTGQVSNIEDVPSEFFLPSCDDVKKVKTNLVVLVSRILTQYITGLTPFRKAIPKHIMHIYSKEMSQKSHIFLLDILMKNEVNHADMIEIMAALQNYVGDDYNMEQRIASGGDQLACERQVGSQRHMMCGNTMRERLELLEPVTEDWHCLVCLLKVCTHKLYIFT